MNRARLARALRELASAALTIADAIEPLEGAPDAAPLDETALAAAVRQVELISLCAHMSAAFAPLTERKSPNA